MSKPVKVPFSVSSGEPVVVKFTATNGRQYEARVGVAVFELFEKQMLPTGMPDVDVRVNLSIDVRDAT